MGYGHVPKLEIVKVPDEYSAGESFLLLALSTNSFHVRPIENKSISCALMMVGVMRPPSIATAMATLTSLLYLIPPSTYAALTMGC